jgi:hypothetical protein
MNLKLTITLLVIISCLVNADDADKAPCDAKCQDKSAVTKEAADAAAKVIKNPPNIYNTEVYTSKVKSIYL